MENSTETAIEFLETTDSEDDAVDCSDYQPQGARHLCKKGEDPKSSSDSENLSDIADAEVDCYLNNEKEKNLKKRIWEIMNQKYLQEQEAKKVAAASKVSYPKRKQRNKTATNVNKAKSNAKTTQPEKRPSSKINYEALSKLFEEEPGEEDNENNKNTKRARSESVPTQGEVDDIESGAADESDDDQNGWEERSGYEDSHYDYNDPYEDYLYDCDGDDGLC